jgi:predicted DCC family thiol-disulfide oxidoreductase YuxK
MTTPHDTAAFEVFFDGDCPLCAREIDTLQRWDRKGSVRFTDIAARGFDAGAVGRTQGELTGSIHGRFLSDGSWVDGVEVFRQLYSAVGLGPLVTLTRLPGVSGALDAAYAVFARNRLRITGRCDAETCSTVQQVTT